MKKIKVYVVNVPSPKAIQNLAVEVLAQSLNATIKEQTKETSSCVA
ncbi:hypothetical protein M3226_02535 [Neobacillus cucumis]|nr:hypothetical protein [Neobacillus cucumis]MCM3724579.1 hypothetical protein [Neobacillus cucumis]